MLFVQFLFLLPLLMCASLKRSREEFEAEASLSTAEQLIESSSAMQHNLAANLGIQGFLNLPAHEDLKVFQELKFPATPLGKAFALAFVLKTARLILSKSMFYDQLLGIVFDEAAELVQNDKSVFRFFVDNSSFFQEINRNEIVTHFLKTKNFASLVALGEGNVTCWEVDKIIRKMSMKKAFETIGAISRYLTDNPDHFKALYSDNVTALNWITFLCSDLPMETVNDLLRAAVAKERPGVIFYSFFYVFTYQLQPSLPNQDQFCAKMVALIDFVQEIHPTYDYKDLKVLARCRYQNYHLVEEAAIKALLVDNYNLHNQLCLILFAMKEYDQAFKFLPTKPSGLLVEFVCYDVTYREVLFGRKPEWAKKHLLAEEHFLCMEYNPNSQCEHTLTTVVSLGWSVLLSRIEWDCSFLLSCIRCESVRPKFLAFKPQVDQFLEKNERSKNVLLALRSPTEINLGHQFYNIGRQEFVKLVLNEICSEYLDERVNSFDFLVNLFVLSLSWRQESRDEGHINFNDVVIGSGAKTSRLFNCLNAALSRKGKHTLSCVLFEAFRIIQICQDEKKSGNHRRIRKVQDEKLEVLLSENLAAVEQLEKDFTDM